MFTSLYVAWLVTPYNSRIQLTHGAVWCNSLFTPFWADLLRQMGGVKNKEQKKKAQHVYSSGGGSGGKGPAILDKRNQELPCPHCDRTFKQVCHQTQTTSACDAGS